ncbi:M48 family metallopeptidase [Amycolatopsis thailandensis]|uniref:M48 family metallopeptidase n=1 Tax=Amycolatopsis thailandensis TaxID=589330 RepID=UPI00362DDCC0
MTSFDEAVVEAGLPSHWSWRVEVRPRRRTLGLDVLPDGSIVIAIPQNSSPEEVTEAVRARRVWLARAVRRRAELAAEHPAKELVDGEGFSYLGRHYRLLLVRDQEASVKLKAGWLNLRLGTGASAVIGWYADRGRRWLAKCVDLWAGRIGVDRPLVTVKDLGTRWGVRNRDGSLTFHWAVMQLSPELLDLIVVHELVHLVASRHDDEFVRRVLLALPTAVELESELAKAGRLVWMGRMREPTGRVAAVKA